MSRVLSWYISPFRWVSVFWYLSSICYVTIAAPIRPHPDSGLTEDEVQRLSPHPDHVTPPYHPNISIVYVPPPFVWLSFRHPSVSRDLSEMTEPRNITVLPISATNAGIVVDPVIGYCFERRRDAAQASTHLSISNSLLPRSYTKSVWINPYDYVNNPQIMSAGTDSTSFDETGAHFLMITSSGAIEAAHNYGPSEGTRYNITEDVANGPVPIHTWTHVAVSYDHQTGVMTLYRNSVLVKQSTSLAYSAWTGGKSTSLGNWAGQYGFNGCINDAQVYAQALTHQQIIELYRQQSPGTTPQPPTTKTPTTVAPTTSPPVTSSNFQFSSGLPGSNRIGFRSGSASEVMLGTPNVYLVYYGDWPSNHPAIDIINGFVANLGGTPWYNIGTTYYQIPTGSTTRQYVNNSLQFAGYTISPVDPTLGGAGMALTDTNVYTILVNAVKQGKFRNGATTHERNGIYLLLTSENIKLTSGFCTSYCGWHSSTTVTGVRFRYGVIGNPVTQCPGSCTPQRPVSPNGDFGGDGMVSIVAHEIIEMVTDPDLSIWHTNYVENADMCAWKFGAEYRTGNNARANMRFANGKDYLVQQNWQNHNGGKCVSKIE